jgi:hypothetical protein
MAALPRYYFYGKMMRQACALRKPSVMGVRPRKTNAAPLASLTALP